MEFHELGQSRSQQFLINRFKQIIYTIHFECPEGILIISCRENNRDINISCFKYFKTKTIVELNIH